MTQDDMQPNWRWCRKCEGLYFGGHSTRGKCPVGGQHEIEGSGEYGLHFAPGPDQPNWRWCRKCEGLYFAGHSARGKCPAGGQHDITESGEYRLCFAPAPEPLSGSSISGYITGKRDLVQQVCVVNRANPKFRQYASLGSNGYFEFLNLPNGSFRVYPTSVNPRCALVTEPKNIIVTCQGNQSHNADFKIVKEDCSCG